MSCSRTFWSDDDVGVPYLPAFDTVMDAMHHEGQREFSLLREVPDKMECLACRCTFTNREDQVFSSFVSNSFINVRHRRWRCHFSLSLVCQVEHYKLDWHRFNLKQKMLGTTPVTAEEFEKRTGEGEQK